MDSSIIPSLSEAWRSELRALLEARAHLEHGQAPATPDVPADAEEVSTDITVLETLIVPRVERDPGPELLARLGPAPDAHVDWTRLYAGDGRARELRARCRAHRNGTVAAVRLVSLSVLDEPHDLDEVIAKGPGDPLCADRFDVEIRNLECAQRALHVPRAARIRHT
ncbi:MAG: hypothetical protein ACOYNI_04970 [Acidimicrobiia bacterium]